MSGTEVESIPLDVEHGRVFDEPWHAQAFSVLVALHRTGRFEWKHWAEVFSNIIKQAPALPGESPNQTYYRQWVSALEEMVIRLDLMEVTEITGREQEWRQAYLNTPHGQAVQLMNATCRPTQSHVHPTRGAPASISPARLA